MKPPTRTPRELRFVLKFSEADLEQIAAVTNKYKDVAIEANPQGVVIMCLSQVLCSLLNALEPL